MGGRGASSGVSVKGKKYGTEYRTLLQYKNIKFVQYNDARNSKVPMETMTKGRIYVTVGKGGLRSISLYNRKGLRLAQIDIAGTPHKINNKPELPHVHIGFNHNEHGDRKPNWYERRLINVAKSAYNKYKG